MKVEIKSYHSPDIYDLENYKPEQEDCFGFLLRIFIGPVGGKGEESLDFVVRTPRYLIDAHMKKKGDEADDVIFGRGYIIVFEYNFEKILDRIKKLIDSVEEDNWDVIGQKLSRYGYWEFEDYREDA